MAAEKPRRLGRGLEALIVPAAEGAPPSRGMLQGIAISEIRPNPYQPRREFRAEELAELEASLRVSGLLQPITVRPAPSGRGYELIAGERRLRAATNLGWSEIAAAVKEVDDRTLLTLALVENLQRADLNPIEEAEGYKRLIEEFELTQQQVADAVGKERTTVNNLLRLLALPPTVRRMVEEGRLSLGHARPLLGLGEERLMADLARAVVEDGLSVREVERRVMNQVPERRRPRRGGQQSRGPRPQTKEARHLEDQLRRYLQTDVKISLTGPEQGAITVSFYSGEDLERILELVLGAAREV
ncbi:MAG TPA: ParB/RepB/Spo0J family partition protein [Gemmatimonadaceae bacterium]|nr:ParB/RepB/Spo0J family partition protein [Gemmatimonadaceae bacterium]